MSRVQPEVLRNSQFPSARPPARPGVRPLVAIFASALLACGGGSGPSGPGQDHFAISPAGLTLQVGTSGTLTASLNNVELPHAIVAWRSFNPLIAPVDTSGHVRGASIGATLVVASSGSGVDTVPVIVVDTTVHADSACDGIASINQWQVHAFLIYSDNLVTPAGVYFAADYHAAVSSTLSRAGTVDGKLEWAGELAPDLAFFQIPLHSPIGLFEIDSDHVSDPTEVIYVTANPAIPILTPGVDGFRLEVDTAACTFRFLMAPSVHVHITVTEHAVNTLPGPDEGTRTADQDAALGILQLGVSPLGDWRAGNMADTVHNFDAYSIVQTVPIGVTAFTPSGVAAQVGFFDPLNPVVRTNKADTYYSILPVIP